MGKIGFVKATILGGLLFLLPLVVVVLIIGKAYKISMVVAKPLGNLIPIDSIGGLALANILAVLVILVLCYMAGLVARFSRIKNKVASIEEMLIATIPGYGMSTSIVTTTSGTSRYPVRSCDILSPSTNRLSPP